MSDTQSPGNWHDEPDNTTPADQPPDRTDVPEDQQVESAANDGTPGAVDTEGS